MREEQRTLAERQKVATGLTEQSEKMLYRSVDQALFCRRCLTRVEDGRACGKNLTAVFWYCPTCDAFLEWHAFGMTEGMTEQCQAEVRSFLRRLKYRSDSSGRQHQAEKTQGNDG